MGGFGLIVFGKYQTQAGSAPDNTPLTLEINPEALRVDLAIFDNIALVAFSDDGKYFGPPREFPAGVLSSLDIRVKKWQIQNKVAGAVARYSLTAYSDAILIPGREYVRNL